MIISREELSWAAGFFDGEGCIAIKQGRVNSDLSRSVSLVVRIAQNDFSCHCLKRFQAAVGGMGNIRGPYRGSDFALEFHKFEEMQAVVAMLWHFLSVPKKKQILAKFKEARERGFYKSQWSRCVDMSLQKKYRSA